MRILVIEDNRQTAAFIERGLMEEGFAVDVAGNGEEGQQLAETCQYDLLIIDIMLPLKDGLEVCRELRQGKVFTPILILTGKRSIEDRVSGLDAGADDYLVKPFAFEELAARVRALLRREPRITQPILTVGSLAMDTIMREVTLDGQPVNLTMKEFALLEYLLRHPNIVVTRTSLEQHIWNQEFESTSNLVDVYIRRLRKKIGGERANIISTVRGAGYRLVKRHEVP
jgi:DNA-binding response OmpR family regulator